MNSNPLNELISFIKNPQELPNKKRTVVTKLRELLLLLSWTILSVICIGSLLLVIINKTNFTGTNVLESFIQNESVLNIIANSVIIAPTVEETLFRLPLVNQTPHIAVALATTIILGISQAQRQISFLLLMPSIPLITVLIAKVINTKPIQKVRDFFYKKHYKILFYVTALAFGSAHLINYRDIQSTDYIIPLLVVPQMIIGVMLGYIRTQFGFKYALLFHSSYNAMLVIPALLVRYNQENTLQFQLYGIGITLLLGYGLVTLVQQLFSRIIRFKVRR
jgi:uncharacterized protein